MEENKVIYDPKIAKCIEKERLELEPKDIFQTSIIKDTIGKLKKKKNHYYVIKNLNFPIKINDALCGTSEIKIFEEQTLQNELEKINNPEIEYIYLAGLEIIIKACFREGINTPLQIWVMDDRITSSLKSSLIGLILADLIYQKIKFVIQPNFCITTRELNKAAALKLCYKLNGIDMIPERMDKIFNDYRDFILVYIDDILVFSETAQEHRKHLFIFASLAYENGLVISKKKVEIGKSRIEYLGLIIENGRVQLQENIIKTILSFPDKLKDKKHLQSFLGHLNYAINFIPWCSLIREKLQSKLRGNKTFDWSEEDTQSLRSIKKFIKENVKPLELPTDEDDLYIQTDASDLHWGAVFKKTAR